VHGWLRRGGLVLARSRVLASSACVSVHVHLSEGCLLYVVSMHSWTEVAERAAGQTGEEQCYRLCATETKLYLSLCSKSFGFCSFWFLYDVVYDFTHCSREKTDLFMKKLCYMPFWIGLVLFDLGSAEVCFLKCLDCKLLQMLINRCLSRLH